MCEITKIVSLSLLLEKSSIARIQLERAEQTSKRQAKLSRSRAKRSAEQQAYDQAHKPWPEALTNAVDTVLGKTYGPEWKTPGQRMGP